jgi:hypothetical protein
MLDGLSYSVGMKGSRRDAPVKSRSTGIRLDLETGGYAALSNLRQPSMKQVVRFAGPNGAVQFFGVKLVGVKLVGVKGENGKKLVFSMVFMALVWFLARPSAPWPVSFSREHSRRIGFIGSPRQFPLRHVLHRDS